MATYAIGDIQGCYGEFRQLLKAIDFSPKRDRLILLGDLVNRGPNSLPVVKFAMRHEACIDVVLGNHDLHLLAALEHDAIRRREHTFEDILQSKRRDSVFRWLCRQRLAIHSKKLNIIATHAGIYPLWSLQQTLLCAAEVEVILQGSQRSEFLKTMFGPKPQRWDDALEGFARARFIVNALTRMRYVTGKGKLNFTEVRALGKQDKKLHPWFAHPKRVPIAPTVVFGHWSSLGVYMQPGILAMDSGCCWGRCLSAVRLDKRPFKITQVECDAKH